MEIGIKDNEYIYCAVNSKNEIQWVIGSSKKTKYYATDKYLKQAIEWHNKYYPNDIWHVAKFELKEVDYEEG